MSEQVAVHRLAQGHIAVNGFAACHKDQTCNLSLHNYFSNHQVAFSKNLLNVLQ